MSPEDIEQPKRHLIATARMTDREAQVFCELVIQLAQQGQTFTAWEASRAALQPLIFDHPGLRHAQTKAAVHALMSPYLASGAYHVEPVHAGPGRDPLLYYPNEAGLRSWLAARPAYCLLREGLRQPHVPSANEIALKAIRVPQQVGGAAAVGGPLVDTNTKTEAKSPSLYQPTQSELAVLAVNCGIAQACGACRSQGGPSPMLPVLVPAELAQKWKVQPPAPSKKRGAPKKHDPIADRELCEHWQSARACGATKKEFAVQTGRKLTDIDKALDREQKRRKARPSASE